MILLMGVGCVSLSQYPPHTPTILTLILRCTNISHISHYPVLTVTLDHRYFFYFPGEFRSTSEFSSYKSHTQNIPLAESVWNAQRKHTGVMIELSSPPTKSSRNGMFLAAPKLSSGFPSYLLSPQHNLLMCFSDQTKIVKVNMIIWNLRLQTWSLVQY